MCEIKIALSKLSEKNFSRKWPSLWAKPIDTLENWVVKLPCRRSMIPGSRMQLWTFLVDRTYQRDIKPVPALSCGGVFRYRSGERLHGMQEVSGSIPLFSTKKALYFVWSSVLFFLLSWRSHWKSSKCLILQAHGRQPPILAVSLFLKMLVRCPTVLQADVSLPLNVRSEIEVERDVDLISTTNVYPADELVDDH